MLERRGERAARARALAQEAFEEEARTAARLARSDPESAEIVRRRIAAQERAREAAGSGDSAQDAPDPLGSALLTARALSRDLSARQEERRDEARDEVNDDTRRSVIIAVVAGLGCADRRGGARLAARGVAAPPARRPGRRHRPARRRRPRQPRGAAGPPSCASSPSRFNAMAGDLDAAHQRASSRAPAARGDDREPRRRAGRLRRRRDRRVASTRARASSSPSSSRARRRRAPTRPLPARDGRAPRRGRRRPDDDRTLAVTAAAPGRREGGVVWTVRDVTERARLERLKSEFVATASHELRSPLTSIKGFVELLVALGRSSTRRQREFVDVDPALDRTGSSTSSTTCSTSRASRPGQLEIHRAADGRRARRSREVATLMRPRIEDKAPGARRRDRRGRCRPRSPTRRALRQIVTNLLTNAHLYTPAGRARSRVRLEAERARDRASSVVRHRPRHDARGACERIFDRFYRGADERTQPRHRPRPVDRQVARRPARRHDRRRERARRRARRSPSGSRAAAPERRGRLPREALRGRRVLVVDDEPDDRRADRRAARAATSVETVRSRTPAPRRSTACAASASTR